MRKVVRDRAADGTTVFFSSHILSEVQAVCDRVGVMDDGELTAVDTIDGLRESVGGHATLELECATPPTTLGIESVAGVERATVEEATLVVECTNPTAKVDVVTHVAERAAVEDIRSETVSLEQLFADLTDGGRDESERVEVSGR